MDERLKESAHVTVASVAALAPPVEHVRLCSDDGIRCCNIEPAVSASELTVEILTRAEDMAPLHGDYERLRRLAGIALPFVLQEWHLAWYHRLLRHNANLQDSLLVLVVRNPAGACVAIVPLLRTRRTFGPGSVVSLDILGPDKALTEIRLPLIEPGYAASVTQAVVRELANIGNWDWLEWWNLDVSSVAVLQARGDLRPLQPLPHYVLSLPESWDVLRKGLKRNIRESLRHCYNSLKRDGLEFDFVAVSEPSAVHAALQTFLELHAQRAAMTDTVAHANHFAGRIARDFLFDVCGRLAACGKVRVFQLIIGGKVVATRIGFVVDDSLYLYYSGYDPALAKYSIMTTTVAEILKYAIAEKLRIVNFSTGKDNSKLRWGPTELSIQRAVLVNPRLRSRLAWALSRWLRSSTISARLAPLMGGIRRNWA